MGWSRKIWGGILLGAAALLAAVATPGDTIVLKNGRRITALSVTQEGDKVTYETSAGTLTLPKAIEDHIEHGTLPAADVPKNPAKLALRPPETEAPTVKFPPNMNEIKRRVLQTAGGDRNYVAKLENKG